MPTEPITSTRFPRTSRSCTDPIVGAILSGWRYDISSISKEMRTDYENHLGECTHCQDRQRHARFIDVLLISVSTLSIVAFLLMSVIMHHVELTNHLPAAVPVHYHQTVIAISLEAVAIAGLVVSMVLWILVAIATPLPGIVSDQFRQRVPADLRERLTRRHAA